MALLSSPRRQCAIVLGLSLVVCAVTAPRSGTASASTSQVGSPGATASYQVVGGDDVTVYQANAVFERHDLAIASNGDIYNAVQVKDPASEYEIKVFRSQDGGLTWNLWGGVSDPSPFTHFLEPSLVVAEGNADRLFLACRRGYRPSATGEIHVYRSDLGPSASFVDITVMADASIEFMAPDMATDAANYSAYFLYLVARGGGDIYFARSRDMGNTWEPAYVVGEDTEPGSYYDPRVCYGFGNYIHTTWFLFQSSGDHAVRYRRAATFANGGLPAWDPAVAITSATNGINERGPSITAALDGGKVLVACYRPDETMRTELHVSEDQGASWPAGNVTLLEGTYPMLCPVGPGADWVLAAHYHPAGPAGFYRAPSASPLAMGDFQNLSDGYVSDAWEHVNSIALDPTRGNRAAMCWTDAGLIDGEYSGFNLFDAEWLGDPGYPNTQPGFPVALPVPADSPPALVDLHDLDAWKEIVFSTADGQIHVYNPDGSLQPGWPIGFGTRPDNAPVAVGDLDGDGIPEIVAGTDNGVVFAFHANGSLVNGFPVFLNTGADTYVAIGMIGPPGTRSIAVTSGRKLFVIDHQGDFQGVGYPVLFTADHTFGPAIGDVDDDGVNEIVTARADFVHVHKLQSATPAWWRRVTGKTFNDAPTLADLDLDGDLEVAVPTTAGDVYVLEHDLTDYEAKLPYTWPFSTATGGPVTSVAFAQNLGTSNPELAFAARNQEVYLMYEDGRTQTGYPRSTGAGWFLLGAPILDCVVNSASSVVIGSRDEHAWAWPNIVVPIPGWPRDLGAKCNVSPASGDIDLDGRNELVFVTDDALVVLDVGQPPNPDVLRRWPMYAHDPMRTGCLNYNEATLTGFGDLPGPTRLTLSGPSPNPVRGSALFEYQLPERCAVQLGIFDAQGRRVRMLCKEEQEQGLYSHRWNGEDDARRPVANGVYFVRLQVAGPGVRETLTRKVAVLR